VSEPVFMAQIRAADIPESMPVSRAIRDFMVAHPPTPEGQPKEELLQLLMLSVMRLEGRVVVLERRSEAGDRHRVSGSAGRDLPKTELVPLGRWRRHAALCGGHEAPIIAC
jgi:hypothetical protein